MRRLREFRIKCGLPSGTFVMALALGLGMSPSTGHATIAVRDLWATDGEVRAVAQANNTLYVGGTFSHVGPATGSAVALDPVTAVARAPYPKVAGTARAVVPDGNGGWYIGGSFTALQGKRRDNLAHIDANGLVTSWNPGVDGEVLDIAAAGGVVYVVGWFQKVGTSGGNVIQRDGVVAINAATGIATHWDPDPDYPPNEVEVGDGKVYLAGDFRTMYSSTAPQPRAGVAEFTEVIPGNIGSGALTGTFAGADPSFIEMNALELTSGKLFMGGRYTSGTYVRIYDVTAGSYVPYNVEVNGYVYDMALNPANGTFFVGGSFDSIAGQPRTNLAALDLATGTVVPSWNIAAGEFAAGSFVQALTLTPNGLFVGGYFFTLGGASREGLGLVDPLSSTVLGWDPRSIGIILSTEFDGTSLYVAGGFPIINTVPRTNLAAIDEASGVALSWSPSTNGPVEALMVNGSTVYVGGQFSTVNGTTRNRAAAVDAVTGALTAFNPNVDPFGPTTVKTFAISGSMVYMGGVFTTVRGVERIGIAAVSATTGALLTWNPFSNGAVHSITYVPGGILSGPLLFVGGDFTYMGGVRDYVAMLDPATAAALNPLNSPNGPVYSMFVEPLPPGYGGYNEIFMGGPFSTVGGQPRNRIASLAAFGAVTAWNPNANGIVYSIRKVGSTVYVGGQFGTIGGQNRTGLAAIDGAGTATVWDPLAGFFGSVYSIVESAGTLYVGGSFAFIAQASHAHFAGLDQVVTAVNTEPAPGVVPTAVRAAPNPFDQSTKIQLTLATNGETRVTVYDVAGRRVRDVYRGWLPSGRHTIPWDGRNDGGQPVAAGVYFVGVKTQAATVGSKVYRLN